MLLLSQLMKIKISYYNKNNYIIIKRGDKEFAYAKESWDLFIFKSIIKYDLIILTSIYEKPTYFKPLINIRQL